MNSTLIHRQNPALQNVNQRTPIPQSNNPEPTIDAQATASTESVVDRHLKCFFEGDLNGLLSDYAPEAVLFTRGGPLRGKDEIRPLFEAMIAEFAKPGAKFSLKQKIIEPGYAYILWTAETADNFYDLGTDTFVVKDGKIVVQSFTNKMISKDLKHFGGH